MKLVQSNYEYHLLGDYNTNEEYDSRIQKGTPFYKDEFKDVVVASYPPASKVSRPILASTDKGFSIEIPLLDKAKIESMLKNTVDVNSLSEVAYPKDLTETSKGCFDDMNEADRNTWKEGFNTSQELNADKKYTLSDLISCMDFFLGHKKREMCVKLAESTTTRDFHTAEEVVKLYLKSKEQTEWDVEVEMEMATATALLSGYIRKPQVNKEGFVTITSIKH